MTSSTDQGRPIQRVESFVVSHTLNPRTGPSIAFSSTHAYVVVKITDADGRSGWGETYLVPGIPSIIEAVAPVLMGRSASRARSLGADMRWAGGGLVRVFGYPPVVPWVQFPPPPVN